MTAVIILSSIILVAMAFWAGRAWGGREAQFFKQEKEKKDREAADLQLNLIDKEKNLATMETQLLFQEERLSTHKKEVQELQEQFKIRFENLANKILEERSQKLQETSEKNLQQLLSPFKEKMHLFQQKMENIYAEESREIFSMKNEIGKIIQANQKISEEANNLTRALKGDVKMQGNWGELVLEKILEASGLREGQEYILQGKAMDLKDNEGRRKLPDVTIKLPGEKNIFVDSKVSLVSYERSLHAQNDQEREAQVKDFLKSVYAHTDLLSSKEYTQMDLSTPDFVMLFFPIESAFALALQSDPEIYQYALQKSIVLVGPTTLLATLRTVAYVWKQERQAQNVQEIARQGGALYDKFCSLVDDIQELGQRLDQAQTSYHGMMNKLSTGKGNLMARAQRLRELGVKTNKVLSTGDFEEDIPSLPAD
jgi:DNA recombination protein RmuC